MQTVVQIAAADRRLWSLALIKTKFVQKGLSVTEMWDASL